MKVKTLTVFGEEYVLSGDGEVKVSGEVHERVSVSAPAPSNLREEIIHDTLAAMNVAVLGRVAEDGSIVLSLNAGTYSLKYEKSDGTLVDIGEVTVQ